MGYAPIGSGPRVAAVVRVRGGRSVVRVQDHGAGVPVRPKADGTHNVRVHEVGVDGAVKIPYKKLCSGGQAPSPALRVHPRYWGKQRSPPQAADAEDGAEYAFKYTMPEYQAAPKRTERTTAEYTR